MNDRARRVQNRQAHGRGWPGMACMISMPGRSMARQACSVAGSNNGSHADTVATIDLTFVNLPPGYLREGVEGVEGIFNMNSNSHG